MGAAALLQHRSAVFPAHSVSPVQPAPLVPVIGKHDRLTGKV